MVIMLHIQRMHDADAVVHASIYREGLRGRAHASHANGPGFNPWNLQLQCFQVGNAGSLKPWRTQSRSSEVMVSASTRQFHMHVT